MLSADGPVAADMHARCVDVWPVSLDDADGCVVDCFELLSDDERVRADRQRAVRRRTTFVAARGALRTIAGRYLDTPPRDIVFARGTYGKPYIVGATLRFNVSHCDGLALLAFADGLELGVDVEAAHRVVECDAIAARLFCEHERAALQAYPPAARDRAFLQAWTRYEAVVKTTGIGLSQPHACCGTSTWRLERIDVGTHFIAALAYRGEPRALRQRATVSLATLLAARSPCGEVVEPRE